MVLQIPHGLFPYVIPSKPKSAKPRETLAKQITKLAKQDDVLARAAVTDLCKFGRNLSDLEQRIRNYYALQEDLEMAVGNNQQWEYFDGKREKIISYQEACQMALSHVRKGIADIVIEALDTSNADTILELANAVLFFKDKRGKKFRPVDRERGLLLIAKHRLTLYEQQWTIREVAEYLAGGKVETPADGFSALRRKCREIDFPLAPSRKIAAK